MKQKTLSSLKRRGQKRWLGCLNGERPRVDDRCAVGGPEDQLVFGLSALPVALVAEETGSQAGNYKLDSSKSVRISPRCCHSRGPAAKAATVPSREARQVRRWVCVLFCFFSLFLSPPARLQRWKTERETQRKPLWEFQE